MLSALYSLLLVITLFCSSLIMFGPPGVFVFALVAILPLLLNQAGSIFRAIVYYAAILLVIALLLPAISCAREAARCIQCRNHLKQLALALHYYQQEFESLPPSVVYDANGRPMHSWRVLILPYLEGATIYKEYDFNEPWDGPNNKSLLDKRPRGFACYSDTHASDEDESLTSYVAFVGPNTIWSGKRAGLYSINSVMLVETLGSDIKWTEPRDYVVPSAQTSDPRSSPLEISSNHTINNGFYFREMPAAHVAFSDGSVRLLPVDGLSDENLLHTGGDWDDDAVDRWLSEHRRIQWPHCIAFAVWIVSIVLLLHWSVRCRRTPNKYTAENVETIENNDGAGEG